MPGPRSLVEMCMKVALDNIHLITSLRNMPNQYVQQFLGAVRSAEQLNTIELDSDEDIYEDSPVHWRRIIARDFPILSRKNNFVPSNPRSWYKVWKKYKSLQAKEDAAATEKLMQSMAVQREAKDARRPPILSMQESRKLPLPKPIKPGASTSHWSAQPRDREKKTFLQKARREVAAETKRFRLPTATGKLPVAAGQITKAPAAMLAEARIRNQPLSGTNRMLAPRKLGPSRPHDEAEERRRRENEARLQRIKNPAGSKTATPNLVSFSSEESDESHDETGPSHSRAASKQSAKRRGGFLSAAPGANPAGQRVPVRPSEQDNDLFGDMEFDDSRPASNKQPTKRHHGAPGTSSAGHQFPTRRKSPTHTSPPPPDLSRGPAASPHSTSTMPNMAAVMQRKRKPVDVFMRPDKKPRR